MRPFEHLIVPAMLVSVIGGSLALCQPAGDPPRDGDRNAAGDRGGQRGNFDPQQFRQRMYEQIKTQLKASDDEWSVIQPKLDKVMDAQRAMRPGWGMRGNRGNRPGGPEGGAGGAPASDRPQSDLEKATTELRTALDAESTSATDLAAKLAAVRAARAKAQAELTAARDELKQLLTARQEAVLVMMGSLE